MRPAGDGWRSMRSIPVPSTPLRQVISTSSSGPGIFSRGSPCSWPSTLLSGRLGTPSERAIRLRRELPANWDNVSVAAWGGLTAAFCRQHGASVIIRGVRNRSDFRHESQLAAMNEAMGVTTLLLPAQPGLVAVSSTVLRGLGT